MAESLKETHPQKYYFKLLCKVMYCLGMGDFWYEDSEHSRIHKKFYKVWHIAVNLFIYGFIVNELCAHFRSDLNEKQLNDLKQFTVAHPSASFKMIVVYWKRQIIIDLLTRVLKETKSVFNAIELERASMKTAIRYWIMLLGSVYMALSTASSEAIRTYITEGTPIGTEVVYYPRASNSGILINILRFIIEFHWYYLIAMMLSVDCFVVCFLMTVKYKFQLVQLYFQNMRTKVLENLETKPLKEVEEEFKKDFVAGIKMHVDALWCARKVQDSLGFVYSTQVFQSVGLLVMTLVKLVNSERNFVNLVANLAYMTCLFVLTGIYMMASGDITHEASLVATSMFYCGWDLIRARSDIRVLAVVALQCSQLPVEMTAFNILVMSYNNFISVIRSSYSFFAVMY